jgi:hypothetical protein
VHVGGDREEGEIDAGAEWNWYCPLHVRVIGRARP